MEHLESSEIAWRYYYTLAHDLVRFHDIKAPSICDSLMVPVNGDNFRAVSIRTTTNGRFPRPEAERLYHVLAVFTSMDMTARSILTHQLYS